MKTTIYNFKKVTIVFLLLVFGIQFGFSRIDADISLIYASPTTCLYSYGQKITYNFRVTNNSFAPYGIDQVVLRNYLSDGLEYYQSDNSLTWIDNAGVLESTSNDFITGFNSIKNISIFSTVFKFDLVFYALENKIESLQQSNKGATNIKIEEEAIPNGFEFDISLNYDWI